MDMDSNSSDQLWLFVYLFLTSFSIYHRKIQVSAHLLLPSIFFMIFVCCYQLNIFPLNAFHLFVQGWMETYPKKASIIRLVGEGDWLNQFRAVVLIRVSPFPYM
ncbi:hypothetical protein Dimus_001302 [Dionaea muscipula]